MNTAAATEVVPTQIGTAFAGGFFAGRFFIGADAYALIVSPKGEGEIEETPWNKALKNVTGALSYNDGHANTLAMAKAGSALAKRITELQINGFNDWYLMSRQEALISFSELREAEAFGEEGAEAFARDWYWTSTQSASHSDCAWYQNFDFGSQYDFFKSAELRARAVRRFKI